MAGLQIVPMEVYFGSRLLPCAGLAFVATAAHRRRQGYAVAMLKEVLIELRDSGYLLSALYPFAFPFYRRLGWGQAADLVVYEVPLADFSLGRPEESRPGHGVGRVRLAAHCQPGAREVVEDGTMAALQEVYRRYAQLHNGLMERNEAWWRRFLLRATSVTRLTALWEDETGKPGGYVIYNLPSFVPPPQDIRVRELVAVTDGAYAGLLAFLRNQEAVFRNAIISLPPSDPFPLYLPNPRIKRELRAHHMTRLVNLAPALEAAADPSPKTEAQVILSIADPVCPWNDGDWRLEVQAGRVRVTSLGPRTGSGRDRRPPSQGGRGPWIAADVDVLAALVVGYVAAGTAERAGMLAASSSEALEVLDALYGRRPSHLADYF